MMRPCMCGRQGVPAEALLDAALQVWQAGCVAGRAGWSMPECVAGCASLEYAKVCRWVCFLGVCQSVSLGVPPWSMPECVAGCAVSP